jgi:hypothetical protein
VFELKLAVAGRVELGTACRMKALAILHQARLDPRNIRNVRATKPKRIAHARGSLLRISLGRRWAGYADGHQHQNAADGGSRLPVRSHLALP